MTQDKEGIEKSLRTEGDDLFKAKVYSDQLQEVGNPWGEMMQQAALLQEAEAVRGRHNKLKEAIKKQFGKSHLDFNNGIPLIRTLYPSTFSGKGAAEVLHSFPAAGWIEIAPASDESSAEPFFQSPNMALVRQLDVAEFCYNHVHSERTAGERYAKTSDCLLASPFISNLISLRILVPDCSERAELVRKLADAPQLNHLLNLQLQLEMNAPAADVLVHAKGLKNLQSIWFSSRRTQELHSYKEQGRVLIAGEEDAMPSYPASVAFAQNYLAGIEAQGIEYINERTHLEAVRDTPFVTALAHARLNGEAVMSTLEYVDGYSLEELGVPAIATVVASNVAENAPAKKPAAKKRRR